MRRACAALALILLLTDGARAGAQSPRPSMRHGHVTADPSTPAGHGGRVHPSRSDAAASPAPAADPAATRRDHAFHAPAPIAPPAPTTPASASTTATAAQPAAAPAVGTPVSSRWVAAPPGVAAAAFRRGGEGYVVFDAAVVPDLSGLPGARIIPLEGAVAVAAPGLDGVHEVAGGWALGPASATLPAPFVAAAGSALLARLPDGAVAGRVVAMPDPEGGDLLLVGTLRPGSSVPAATPAAQGTPDATVATTSRGVAVAPLSDAVVLRPTAAGWVLATDGPDRPAAGRADATGTAVAPAAAAAAIARCLDLPDLPVADLRRRLRVAEQTAAAAPAGDRARPRLHVAEAMLALGMGVEASGQVALAAADDPRVRADPASRLFARAAAALSGRAEDWGGDPPRSCAAEAALYADAAGGFAARAPTDIVLLRAAPGPLRARLLPVWAAATATAEPSSPALRALLADDADPALDLARAIAEPDADRSLARLDTLAASPDAAVHLRAARLAIERRLAAGRIDARTAADAMEPLVVAWRGDTTELDTRMRLAGLRAQSGAWRPALAGLREASALAASGAFGAGVAGAPIDQRARATFADALAADAAHPLPPLDLLSLVEENAALLPAEPAAIGLADRLADRLAALDLTDRATRALATLAHDAPRGPPRAVLGERLGRLRLDAGDPQGALAALADSTAHTLPDAVEARRMLLWARATAASGDPDSALAALDGRDDAPAVSLRAELLERQARWPEAAAALSAVAATEVPTTGPIDAAQAETVVRLAVAAAHAGDEATLARLRAATDRVPAGPAADQLRLLTGAPVRTVADLARADRESVLARQVIAR